MKIRFKQENTEFGNLERFSFILCVCVSESHPGYRYYRVSKENKCQCELLMITPPDGSSLIDGIDTRFFFAAYGRWH